MSDLTFTILAREHRVCTKQDFGGAGRNDFAMRIAAESVFVESFLPPREKNVTYVSDVAQPTPSSLENIYERNYFQPRTDS